MAIREGKPIDIDAFVMTNEEEEEVFDSVMEFHETFDELIEQVKKKIPSSRERSLVITKLQEADMWMGMIPLS